MSPTEHIRTLAEELGVECIWHDGGIDYAWAVVAPITFGDRWSFYASGISSEVIDKVRPLSILVAKPSRGVTAYWAALHELGHIACKHKAEEYHDNQIKFEAQAWDWAIHNAILERTAYIQKLIQTRWLGSHLEQYRPKGKWETEFCRRMGIQLDH